MENIWLFFNYTSNLEFLIDGILNQHLNILTLLLNLSLDIPPPIDDKIQSKEQDSIYHKYDIGSVYQLKVVELIGIDGVGIRGKDILEKYIDVLGKVVLSILKNGVTKEIKADENYG